MLAVIMAAALSGESEPLRLNLVCEGQYLVQETSSVSTSKPGELPQWASVEREAMRPGTATVSFEGDSGELVYPDGRRRSLTDVVADEREITARYVRQALLIPVKWKLIINRLTGGISVTGSSGTSFLGQCEPAATKPKF